MAGLRDGQIMGMYFDEPQLFAPATHPALQPGFQRPDRPEQAPALHEQINSDAAEPRSEPVRSLLFGLLGRGVAPVDAPLPAEALKHVLILRYDALGDYLVSTALLRWIKHHSPQCRISVISSYRNDGAMRYDPLIDRRLSIDPQYTFHRSWLSALSLRREAPIDLVIAPVHTRLSKAALIARLAAPNAPRATFLHPGRAGIYGKAFNFQSPIQPWREHVVDRIVNLGRACIAPPQPDTFQPRPYVSLDVSHARAASEYAAAKKLRFRLPIGGMGNVDNVNIHGLTPGEGTQFNRSGKPYIVFSIASHMPERQWDVKTCAHIIKHIVSTWPELVVLVSGGPQRREDAAEILTVVDSPNCLAIENDWLTFCALVCGSEFLVSVDSAPVHIAAAAGRPVVVAVHKYLAACEWYPYDVEWRQIVSPSNVHLNDIPPEVIIEAVTQLVNHSGVSVGADSE